MNDSNTIAGSTPAANLSGNDRMQWFRDAGLGMFIHWGLYSVLGHGEWAQWREDIHPLAYAKLADEFHARQCDVRQWAALAREGGVRYVVFSARHHDGFALWDSTVTTFNSMRSAARRDFVQEYTDAVRAEGLKVGLYFSPADWGWFGRHFHRDCNSPAWQSFFSSGHETHPAEWAQFRTEVHAQLRELMTRYGRIDLLWYDGCWHQSPEVWQSAEMNAMVRGLQPGIVINDRSGLPEDYATPENEIALNLDPNTRTFEVCMCMNDTWGYIASDRNNKTLRQCLYNLLRVRSAGGNLLLNTSPDGEGRMIRENIDIFRGLGDWLRRNGQSIYGCGLAEMCTHGTGFFAQPGLVTHDRRQHCIYYHILRWLGGNEHCVKVEATVTAAHYLATGEPVAFEQRGRMIHFQDLPADAPDALDTVIKLAYDPASAGSAWKRTYV